MQAPDVPYLSVIIPVLNDAGCLRRCLASLRANGIPSTRSEVLVVDNGSVDSSQQVARDAGARLLILPGLRVGELRNRGAAASRGQILAFIDADHEIAPTWVEAIELVLSGDGIGGTGAVYVPPADGTWVQLAYGRLRGRPSGQHDAEWLGSGNLAIRREVFEQLRGFDTRLEACEDVDLCQRMRSAGWRLISDERLGSVHHGDPATLAALFRSELWRGRDNLKVSLRHLTLPGLPSVLIPLVDLLCLALVPIGLLAAPRGGLWLTLGGLAVIVVLAAARVVRSITVSGPTTLLAAGQAVAVGATYDTARALALLFRAPHRRAR
jgi:glycosyltransferase involved in cell wall biosynthesis